MDIDCDLELWEFFSVPEPVQVQAEQPAGEEVMGSCG